MAEDWIKMKTHLYRNPKVCVIADMLMQPDSELARYVNQNNQCDMSVTRNVTRNVTVGALLSIWGTIRHRGKRVDDDLFVEIVDLDVLDDICDIPGFGRAMEYVGWVKVVDDGLIFPRFYEENNVDPEESKREKDRERQKKHRAKQKEVVTEMSRDSHVTVTHREEKRREENINTDNTPKSPLLGKGGFISCFSSIEEQNKFITEFLKTYPAAKSPKKAVPVILGLLESKTTTPKLLLQSVKAFASQCLAERTPTTNIPQPHLWLQRDNWKAQLLKEQR